MTIGAYSVSERAYLAALSGKLRRLQNKASKLKAELEDGGWPTGVIHCVETIRYSAEQGYWMVEHERGRGGQG